ncbi:OB-fold-containig protein [Rufibacter roseus]|uniref:OB-fold-containig protein n=1 Tax=Rufibacter roseus TaxID=1567108 RepID=A0ABW2DRI1_9BACT|nr:OB-fold-containig protein [Rufibacter roseus]
MEELLQAAVAPANVFATGLLIFVMLYWVTVILGVFDISSFDIEFETNVNTDTDGVSSVAWLNSALAFFNLGKVPLMFFLTFFALPYWVLSVSVNYLLGTQDIWLGLVLILPLMLVCLVLSKFMTWPFVKLFDAMEKDGESNQVIIGQTCTILLPANHQQTGQASVRTKGSPLLLNVRTSQGHLVQKGDTALVIEYLPETNLYLIEPYQTL